MMEVARKGIMNPGEFMFSEIMIIFMAVMITDILLLDFFNTLGLPTSTTVSIVFELLGASVSIALIKIYSSEQQTIDNLSQYINNEKAIQIILGILLSVVVAFTIGAIIQYISRLILSFNFDEKPQWISAVFSGIAITAISYFIIFKGLKGSTIINSDIKTYINANTFKLILANFALWTLVSLSLISFFKSNIYKLIIIVGTFALALAFAGNDLVNFIGVPMAAYNAFQDWSISGIPPDAYSMESLAQKVETQPLLLLISGLVMVVTLWFSNKAKAVVKTSVDLSRQDEGEERFKPNFLSRSIVRSTVNASYFISRLIPVNIQNKIEKQYTAKTLPKYIKPDDIPAFDMVRASVNLMVASVLISIATSMKLPLSTTYVTFMVAMGTSLADRAWGTESAVYRVAGVLNVVGGWFFTAIIAFIASGVIAFLINIHPPSMIGVLLVIAITLLVRNYIISNQKAKEIKEEDSLKKAESSSVQGVIYESSSNISKVVVRANNIYRNAIDGLAKQDLNALKKNKKQVSKLSDEVDKLRDNLFFFIKNLDESSVNASNFYINILGYLQDMAQSLEYISKVSLKHINNNHKKLKFSQIKELKEVATSIENLFVEINKAFASESFDEISKVLNNHEPVKLLVNQKIQSQVARTRSDESSPKNTTLYFSILLETKDLLKTSTNLLNEYYNSYDSRVKPATISDADR
jgi:phosphate/sulfate permease